MKKAYLISLLMLVAHTLWSQKKTFADRWKFVGIAVNAPGYTVWGTSPIYGDDGKVHLFVARWPAELKVDPGWRSHSEIAHYVGPAPEGPFTYSEVAVKGSGKDTWDKYGAHNPAVHKVGDTYVILFIANDNPVKPYHGSNQRIGMVTSKSLYGPWKKAGKNGMILAPPSNEKYWNFKARNGVNNPAFLQHPDGGFFLYFKSSDGKASKMGLAIAEELEGPYIQLPWTVTYNEKSVEDGYAFMYNGKVCLLTTDNHGMITFGGGLLWSSDDGIKFTNVEQGYHTIDHYVPSGKLEKAVRHYGPEVLKFERPQVLMKDGKPAYLYAPSGHHIFGGNSTVSYVLKFED
ncbi:MAG: glycoside hydrolase family protein [Cytophagales bacterium]|nr:glycoside hydrolase family protein [Cytophagales bacterium]